MKYIDVEQMNEACTQEYNENYAHGGYCHEQSFRFGFQEGVEFCENEMKEIILDKVEEFLNLHLFNSELYENGQFIPDEIITIKYKTVRELFDAMRETVNN